ncbi:class III signal peptide [Methanobrevibacter oralis]|uniref:Class III signal peptide n=2 Tax=Methanobrevibacter oralis TaxID=66851 RepID=A0A165ZKS9_METOA|nr:class III signal peptide [Methanobrevibacter oralis]
MGENMKILKTIITEKSGQGAAEYILLFGGVLVIALFALTIYRSYMETSDTSLKAKDDIIDVRNTILDNRTHV